MARYRDQGKGIFKLIAVLFPLVAIGALTMYAFHWAPFGVIFVPKGYLYFLIAFLFPLTFLFLPPSAKARRNVVPWYDIVTAALAFSIPFYFFLRAYDIQYGAWEILPPFHMVPLGFIFTILVIEGGRRVAGPIFTVLCALFAIYPLFAANLPGLLEGVNFSLPRTISIYTMGDDGIIGIPMGVGGTILAGFLVFAATLQVVGGGKFFFDSALRILGPVRGGAAKVAVCASAAFGTISGSAVANVVTVGSFTIPQMKKSGYPSHYAGGVEACASTGGVLMPPVMGATAFIMAEFLRIPYSHIIVVAFIPAILYYLGIFLQVDGFAAKAGIKGLPRASLPPLGQTLKDGWFVIPGMFVLLYVLIGLGREYQAAWYATVCLLVLPMIRKKTRTTLTTLVQVLQETGRVLSEVVPVLCAVGLIIGSLLSTGLAFVLGGAALDLSGGNPYFLLVLGAFASFIMGMGLPITPCYIFLALLMAPSLITFGFDPLAVHLFVLYWGMISFITPPVAVAAFAAGSIAEANPMTTGYTAMRIGIAIYFVPFFFVLKPGFMLQGSPWEILHAICSGFLAVFLIGSSAGGYMLKLGKLRMWERPLLILAGFLIGIFSLGIEIIGVCLAALICTTQLVVTRRERAEVSFMKGRTSI